MATIPHAKPIVEDLGGPAVVARALKSGHETRGHISLAAVCQWEYVPIKHCRALAAMPRKNGKYYSLSDLRPDVYGPVHRVAA